MIGLTNGRKDYKWTASQDYATLTVVWSQGQGYWRALGQNEITGKEHQQEYHRGDCNKWRWNTKRKNSFSYYNNTEWNLIKTAINNYSEYANKEVLNNEIAANVCIDADRVVKKIREKCFSLNSQSKF